MPMALFPRILVPFSQVKCVVSSWVAVKVSRSFRVQLRPFFLPSPGHHTPLTLSKHQPKHQAHPTQPNHFRRKSSLPHDLPARPQT